MAILRVPAIALAMTISAVSTSAFASAAARPVPGPSLWELNNVTTGTSSITTSALQPLADEIIIVSFCGVDIEGGDIWHARHPNPDSCVANCLPETGCDAATWTNYEGGTCWFKRVQNSWASAVPRVGAVAFVRTPRNTGRYMGPDFPANIDMPGNDIGSYQPAASATACIKPCATSSFCFAYTWTNYNGGTCWLKSKASPFVHSPGSASSFTGRVTNPDTCLVNF